MNTSRHNKPVILIGMGRSGSTVLHEILSHHPQLAWPSRQCNDDPASPARNRKYMKALDISVVGRVAHRLAYAGEVYKYWDHHFRGFSTPYRDLTADDADLKTIRALNDSFNALTTKNRSRVFVKITGWPRIGFLKKVFPDAKFIYLYRDGRAAAYSYLQTPWCDVWKGPGNWSWGPLTEAELERWRELDESFFALAGILWEKMSTQFEKTRDQVSKEDFFSISYENLCDDRTTVLRSMVEFAELDWSEDLERRIRSMSLVAQNDKWRENLSDRQQAALTESMRCSLSRYGYI